MSTKTNFMRAMVGLAILALMFSVTGNVYALEEPALPVGELWGAEGVAHPNGCFAVGWAQDPDDVTAEVDIRILADGVEVVAGATFSAPEGHVFFFDLWGLIPNYIEHMIVAQALDAGTGQWVDLAGTPKWLNCVNYDIYVLNIKTGDVERLTTLEGTGEYNPSWSPDGKKIVHDVTDLYFHALYITDVKTHESKALNGGDGGNNGVWSPNGKWIVFDRVPAGDPNLYLLPPAGGTPKLVVSDAVNGGWSPNSQRLVFERGGGLWTASIKGRDEKQVVEAGFNPIWSPDGKWIAYDLEGDLWKIRVNAYGAPAGEPIQLTSGPVNEGGATWSQNSKFIVFASDATGDHDLWQIAAGGGVPTQLRGAIGYGDYDPAYSNNGQYIAYDAPMEPSLPHIESNAWLDSYALVDWPVGQPINVLIDDPATSKLPDYRTTFTPDGSSNWNLFLPGLDIKPGTVITAKGRYFTKTLVVSNLAATDIDPVNGTVAGIASPNTTFFMGTDGDHFRLPVFMDVPTDENGNWFVDYGGYDTPLPWKWFTSGEMMEWDEDGDMTHARWHVHQEVIEVWFPYNEIRAFDWPRDTELTFTVYSADNVLLETGTAWTVPLFWMDGAAAWLGPQVQLTPGMRVVVTDGVTAKETIIQDLKITMVDVDNDLVGGYGPLGVALELRSWKDSPVFRFFAPQADGSWLVDYRTPSINGATVDITPGDDIALFVRDAEQDSTAYEYLVP